MNAAASYRHTQKGPWYILLGGLAVCTLALSWNHREETVLAAVLGGSAALFLLMSAAFQHLTVEDTGESLSVRFGPVNLFQRSVSYADIRTVETGRTTILDGWGIHVSLRGGWVWNIWGRDCVVLRLRKGTLRVGTDDVAGLTEFLRCRLSLDD